MSVSRKGRIFSEEHKNNLKTHAMKRERTLNGTFK
jgi:hypothetical protein